MADGKPPVRISHRLLAINRSEMRISMQVYHGKSVFGGIAIGKISVFSKKEHKIIIFSRGYVQVNLLHNDLRYSKSIR